MGKVKFRPHVAPKPLNGIRWNSEYNYVVGVTRTSIWRCKTWVVWVNTWLVTCFSFLVDPFLHYSWDRVDFNDVYVIWRVSAHGIAVILDTAVLLPILRLKPPKNIAGAWIGIFKPNEQKIKTCILSKLYFTNLNQIMHHDKDHQNSSCMGQTRV